MSAHTPGPWLVLAVDEARRYLDIRGGDDLLVAEVMSCVSREEREANARLIAAAPELLARLQRALSRCADCDTCGPARCPECEVDAAAIAKATRGAP